MTNRNEPLRRVTKSTTKPSKPAPTELVETASDSAASGTVTNAERKRARGIAETLAPDAWTSKQVARLAKSIEGVFAWEKGELPFATHPNSTKFQRAELKKAAKAHAERAATLEAAAALLHDMDIVIAGEILAAAQYATEAPEEQASLRYAHELLLTSKPFPLKVVLVALGRSARRNANFCKQRLIGRGNWADDYFVHRVAGILRNRGIAPRASKRAGVLTGSLVVACAMIRGATERQTLRARWVYDAWGRVRKHEREIEVKMARRRAATRA